MEGFLNRLVTSIAGEPIKIPEGWKAAEHLNGAILGCATIFTVGSFSIDAVVGYLTAINPILSGGIQLIVVILQVMLTIVVITELCRRTLFRDDTAAIFE